ncbi:MAG: alpha/beta fold hydrolase [Bacillota bacterium]
MRTDNPAASITLKQTSVAGAPVYHLAVPEGNKNRAVILHGYGGSKEEVLGLGIAAAGAGWSACIPDLPGHGAHPAPLTAENVRRFVAGLKAAGFNAAIGHSLGGRIAMALEIKPLCLLSVPLHARFEGRRTELLRALRARRVREAKPFAGLEDVLAALDGPWPDPPVLLFYAAHDLPSCRAAATRGEKAGWQTRMVRGAMHLDVVSAPEVLAAVSDWLKDRKGELHVRA